MDLKLKPRLETILLELKSLKIPIFGAKNENPALGIQ